MAVARQCAIALHESTESTDICAKALAFLRAQGHTSESV
jgi:hypothetical protein